MRLSRLSRVHFVGIGGSGMSGIAEVLLNLGFQVTGSDLKENATTRALATKGARVAFGHRSENLAEAQVLVFSSAVAQENPEVLEARRRGIPVIPRGEMLAELMRLKTSVAVAGSHGKTTVTAMVAHLAHAAGLDPTVVIGGRLSTLGSSARLGRSDLLVAEADESDRSFLLLHPVLSVVTNIDWEHVDCYPTLDDLKAAFLEFANRVPFFGGCVVCGDDPNVRSILPHVRRRVITYGTDHPADFGAVSLQPPAGFGEAFDLYVGGRLMGELALRQVGHHIVLNALAAAAVAQELQIPFEAVREGLASFPGADRRFELKGERSGVRVVDDYGHHPTEIRAVLESARKVAGAGRVVVLFQPHRYTRVAALMDGFAEVLGQADLLRVSDIYAASETPIRGVSGKELVRRIRSLGHRDVRHCPRVEDMAEEILPALRQGDLVVTLGAGHITTVGERLLDLLEGRHEP
jgi:UDP-N-acetylmuramate--alanine ligase